MRVNPYQVEVVSPPELTAAQLLDMQRLSVESLAADFADAPVTGVEDYEAATRSLRADLNTGTKPGGLLYSGARQRFEGQATALVIDNEDNTLVASLTFADNVSSNLPGLAGSAEMAAKLRMPDMPLEGAQRFIKSRYRYLGQMSVSGRLRQELAEADDTDEASILDALVARAARDALPQQRASAFSRRQEGLWRRALNNAGLEAVGIVRDDDQPFGEGGPRTTLEWWQADRSGDIAAKIGAMRNGEVMLAAAEVELKS